MELKSAIKQNLQYQKKYKKKTYTKPLLFHLIEKFIADKNLICYGGMAINAYLPDEKQFYDKTDIPDYDCFSPNSKKHAIMLANLLAKHNMEKVEVKSAMFPGTMKIYVNFIPIVDITQIIPDIFYNIHKKAVTINNILYAPPNYLKISLYQELSRPLGDINRWEKIYERLNLLNQSHPLYVKHCNISEKDVPETEEFINIHRTIISLIKEKKWVVLGDYGMSFYLKYFPKVYQKTKRLIDVPFILVDCFDAVLPFEYKIHTYDYHFINTFHQITYKDVPVLYVFITNSCQSYNEIKGFNVATMDTILSIYYALSFLNIPHLNLNKLTSYVYLLNNVKSKEGPCRRFHMPCIGNQPSLEDIRKMRDTQFKLYKKNKSRKIYDLYFFQYKPRTNRTKKLNVK